MDWGPGFRQPSLINDELSITTPRPNHVENPVPFGSFNNEGFYPFVTEIPLYTPAQLLKVPSKQRCWTSNRRSKIDSRELTITRFSFVTPTRKTLEHPPLLP